MDKIIQHKLLRQKFLELFQKCCYYCSYPQKRSFWWRTLIVVRRGIHIVTYAKA
ncbi:hypothetical protein Hanom_Chr10g00901591 [Helianthus anomalus]